MNTLEQATERFKDLPEDFQKAISAFDYDHKLSELPRKYKLHIDQSFALEKALADVIFGDIRSEDLIHRLQHDLHTSDEISKQISFDINAHILIPIRESIKKIQQDAAAELEKGSRKAPAPEDPSLKNII